MEEGDISISHISSRGAVSEAECFLSRENHLSMPEAYNSSQHLTYCFVGTSKIDPYHALSSSVASRRIRKPLIIFVMKVGRVEASGSDCYAFRNIGSQLNYAMLYFHLFLTLLRSSGDVTKCAPILSYV